jgi:hypothetical protein
MADRKKRGDPVAEDVRPLDEGKAGLRQKVFREFVLQDGCWDLFGTIDGCDLYQATCESSQVDIYTGNFTPPQIPRSKKGGLIKVCGTKIVLPKANRID